MHSSVPLMEDRQPHDSENANQGGVAEAGAVMSQAVLPPRVARQVSRILGRWAIAVLLRHHGMTEEQ